MSMLVPGDKFSIFSPHSLTRSSQSNWKIDKRFSRSNNLEKIGVMRTYILQDVSEAFAVVACVNFHLFLFLRPLHEVYHLWTLAGGDLEGELKKRGLIKAKPPIMSLPMYVFFFWDTKEKKFGILGCDYL